MPPKKTTPKRKPTTKKPTAKKPTKRPVRKNKNSRNGDKKLPITTLLAVIPMILLSVFIFLRFSSEQQQTPQPIPEPKPQVIVQKVEKKSVVNLIKLFMFDNSIKHEALTIEGEKVTITAPTEGKAELMAAKLKSYLKGHKVPVDGDAPILTSDSMGKYAIYFSYPKPQPKPEAKPESAQPIPMARKTFKAKLAVVIDDCGFSLTLAKQLAKVRYPVTFAVIPHTQYGKETAKLAKKAGKTVFLHFPMQPKSYPKFDPGKGALFLNMPEAIIAATTKANFEFFTVKLDGANNHTGSAFTESREKMSQALREIKKYTPAFLDSYTSGGSKAYEMCQKAGMKCAVNNVFLDNEEPGLITVSDKKDHVHDQLMHAARKALRDKSAIAIGHLKKPTVAALNDSLRQIEDMGVEIVSVTELMN